MPARRTRSSGATATALDRKPEPSKGKGKTQAKKHDAEADAAAEAPVKSARPSERQQKKDTTVKVKTEPNSARKRKTAEVKEEDDEAEVAAKQEEESEAEIKNEEPSEPAPKRRNTRKSTGDTKEPAKETTKLAKKATKPTKKAAKPDLEAGADMAKQFVAAKDAQASEASSKREVRTKANPYGLSPGESPFPTYPQPTPEECQEVNRILEKEHGKVTAPKTIPTPSLNSSGCGEVPSVLDALIRTRLSAATNGANSSRAFRGLVETFGIIKEGVGKGSVNWDKVRLAPKQQVFSAIQSGGLADVKSRDIQKILNMVHEENQARKDDLTTNGNAEYDDATEGAQEKKAEIAKAQSDVLSLDHLHTMTNDEAFNKLLGYPGIGPKTASCVLLFCMQRPSFAVDTHVFRLTRWLGWVPSDSVARGMVKRGESKSAAVTRNSTYAHLEVRIPDELKYPLHYLLIRHGKECGWCSAKAGQAKRVGVCPVAGLMTGKGRSKGSAKGKKGDDVEEEEEEEQDSDEPENEEAMEEAEVKDEKMHGLKT